MEYYGNKEQHTTQYMKHSQLCQTSWLFPCPVTCKPNPETAVSKQTQDSVFISKDQINAEEEFIKKYLNDSNIYKLSEKLDDTLIFSGNIKLKYSEFNIDDYSNIQDYYVFKLNVNADKYKYIFIALALFIAVSIVGLVLTLTMEDKTPGYITLGVSLGLFALTYIGFILLRRKTLKYLSK